MSSEPTIFLITCVVSLALTAAVRELAPLLRFTDDPDGHRKLHGKATPLGGGVAVFLTMAGMLGALLVVPNRFREALVDFSSLPSFLIAGAVIVGVGLADDRFKLRGRDKLIGQVVAASILIFGGLVIQKIGIFGTVIDLGILAGPVTLFWILGAINALNLLDGIDGLATMLGIILSITIAAMAAIGGHVAVAIIAMVFTGALLGFMRYNFPPATVFLGDAGSMLIGLVVGSLAIRASLKGAGTVLLAAPLAVWLIPLLDVVAAIIRRKLTGRSIYATDRGHLHHRLLKLLGSNRKVLGWIAACCALISIATLVSVFLKNDMIAILTCAAVVVIFIVTGAFGRAELLLLSSRLGRMRQLLVSPVTGRLLARQTSIRLEGSRRWELLWATFTAAVERLPLCELRLDVNLPMAGESYYASWERPGRVERERCWRIDIPLLVDLQAVGRVTIVGEHSGASACDMIRELLEAVEPFEVQLHALMDQGHVQVGAENGIASDQKACDEGTEESIQVLRHPK